MFLCLCQTELTMSDYVLLGVLDAKVDTAFLTWSVNKAGGKADWMKQWTGHPPCWKCGKVQRLVVQIYCPLDCSDFHRTLYVFCCAEKQCWSNSDGWSVFRMQCLSESVKTSTVKGNEVFTWNDDADDWGDDDDDWNTSKNSDNKEPDFKASTSNSSDVEDVTRMVNAVNLDSFQSTPFVFHETAPESEFDSYYINVFDEADAVAHDTTDDKHIQELINEYQEAVQEEENWPDARVSGAEEYEKHPREGDVFYKFWKKVNRCPNQVIRYSREGTPLLNTENKQFSTLPKCEYCGEKRIFEFQLMPALIPCLRSNDQDASVEFGTVLVYTCSKSCWKEGYPRKEHIFYSADSDLKYFNSQSL